jgi:hypothetical protein
MIKANCGADLDWRSDPREMAMVTMKNEAMDEGTQALISLEMFVASTPTITENMLQSSNSTT